MPRLDDQEIVRRIAEFMGWTKLGKDEWGDTVGSPPDGSILRRVLPDYLNSYDALAPVAVKFGAELCGPWFAFPPRDHAEAIAIALGGDSETQERSKR